MMQEHRGHPARVTDDIFPFRLRQVKVVGLGTHKKWYIISIDRLSHKETLLGVIRSFNVDINREQVKFCE